MRIKTTYKFAPATKIYNTDEAGFRTAIKSGKFLAEKARKRVDTAASWEGRRNTTVACVMRATASFTHPVFTHPKQKPKYYTKKTWASGVSLHTGWIIKQMILLWL
jgi:hypothetical protein